jgi:putative transcriptional regulator
MVAMAVRLRIADILEDREMTQTELSRRSGISLVTINAMASGDRPPKQIKLDSIDKLCAALEIDPGELFERTTTKKKR